MQFMSSSALKEALLFALQIAALMTAAALVVFSFLSMEDPASPSREERPCGPPLQAVGLTLLPLAFICGGLINLPGFSSKAALLL